MDNVRLFLRSASFRTGRGKRQMDSKVVVAVVNDEDDDVHPNKALSNEEKIFANESEIDSNFSQRSSSSEKLTRENVKSFFSAHPSSSSLAVPSPWSSSQCETCSGLSLTVTKSRQASAGVASASASISNARSFTSENQWNRGHRRTSMSRRHSWASQGNVHHIVSPVRRTRYSRRRGTPFLDVKASSQDRRRRREHRLKSASFPPSHSSSAQPSASTSSAIVLVKALATNACLTAASTRHSSVHFHLRSPHQR